MFLRSSTFWRSLCLVLFVSSAMLQIGCRSSRPQPFVFDPATALSSQERMERVDPSARRASPEVNRGRTATEPTRNQRPAVESAERAERNEGRRGLFRWRSNNSESASSPRAETNPRPFSGEPLGVPPQRTASVGNPAASPGVETFTDHIGAEPELRMRAGRGYRLQPGDPVQIYLRGIPEPADYEYVIADEGTITLPYIPPVQAAGLTVSELQRKIHDTYIDEQIYRQITVNVILPTQSYFVRGEVRQPGRFPLTGGMTVLQAIAAAGGYTEFANPRRVEIIRDGETILENARQMEQNPDQDLPVKAGDVIIVRRSIF